MSELVTDETRNAKFADLGRLQPWLLQQLDTLKVRHPTPIQFHCIPPALQGRDVIGAAKTGSGKTLAFVIPILEKLSVDPYGIFALVLTPTRELAYQIADQFKGLGTPMALRTSVIVGGMDRLQQTAELSRSPHIVIATPGRLADILETSDFSLKRIKFLVLDEADRLMDGRFDKQLKTIWSSLPEKRQTLLYSATITDRVQRMKELSSSDVFLWEADYSKQATVTELDERYSLVNPIVLDATLVAVLLEQQKQDPKGLIIVFTDTCKSTQILGLMLNELGIESVSLHSMINQKSRLAALARFKSSQVKVLIATDLASRGLDIPRVDDSLVKKILKQVNVTKRAQEIKLDQTDFDERRNINKRKRMIMEGRDPDEEEAKREKRHKELMKSKKLAISGQEKSVDFEVKKKLKKKTGMLKSHKKIKKNAGMSEVKKVKKKKSC
ncbi:probable ATP-dependent RNA helicase DDX49 isoform X3 [Macrobrachium rosenbergii]|uniref:probable ATP-dependent RNA helicase DDX49 isoform X3 n=1 Tax=Macrobrachium rosenbergii TaxID=79674 RepID=UPI0034D43D69